VGKVEAVGAAKRICVRQICRHGQTPEAVRAALLTQPAHVAQERSHDAAEPRDEYARARHE